MRHDNTQDHAARRVVESVRAAFPDEARYVDSILLREKFSQDAHYSWIERFSQLTTDAIKRRDLSKASAHLAVLSEVLNMGDEAIVKCIDVAYVESLMWDIHDEELKQRGWALIPENLRALYLAMWGEQRFMRETSE